MTDTEEIISLTIEQANLAHPERKIAIAFGYDNWEETLRKTKAGFAETVIGSALIQYKGADFGLLFGGEPNYLQIMVHHRLRPALVIQGPHHWKTIAMLTSDYSGEDPPVAIPYISGGAVQTLAYPHFPLDGFKWWFVSAVCDRLLLARERLLSQWNQEI
jgi:hypothetical protein